MANYTRDQYEKEIELAKMALRNVIVHNNDQTMVNNARAILKTPKLFERFVTNRLEKKYPRQVGKQFSINTLMFWKK